MRPKFKWHLYKKVLGPILISLIGFYSIYSALLSSTFITYYCEEECNVQLWADPIPPEDSQIVAYIRENFLQNQQNVVLHQLTQSDIDGLPWREVGGWHLILDVIQRTFANLREGFFVEVGAGDGVFLSLTSWLEKEMNWTGLLVEPRFQPFQEMRRHRKAAAAQVCVSDVPYNKKEKFWQPKNTEGMQGQFQKIAEGKSTLLHYVAEEDHELGQVTLVPCFTLDAVLGAANISQKTRIDFMVLNTMGGENEILETLTQREILMLLVHTRQKDRAILNALRLNLRLYDDVPLRISDFYFFINLKVDIIKKKKPNIDL
ncbi:uncharacterized protein [Palaemon carinicauda]|uniref:uncharacterized protein n=1 Tax=Palaemon carinicauda TaxID=392227 RepID=UPI0035B5D7F6